MKWRQTIIEEYFKKQQKLQAIEKLKSEDSVYLISQPILGRHAICCNQCLDFQKRQAELLTIEFQYESTEIICLQDCSRGLSLMIESKKIKKQQQNKNPKSINKKKRKPLNDRQRKYINLYKELGYSNQIISGLFMIPLAQVKNNLLIMERKKIKQEIFLNEAQKEWIIQQASSGSNPMLFNIKLFHSSFKDKFNQQKFTLNQFRKILHQLNIRFRVPSIKPLSFFQKQGRDDEVLNFIQQIWSLKQNGFKFIFVDECSLGNISKHSHKQWHVVGTFKQSIHRVSSYTYMITCIGEQDFLQYQLINGAGKALIFHQFLYHITMKAQEHYQSTKFAIVLDNCRIHTANYVKQLLYNIKHVFTPPYRPEFNAVEHTFGWIKRKIAGMQPLLFVQFIYQIHQIFNQITSELIENWCNSIYKPMQFETAYLLNDIQ